MAQTNEARSIFSASWKPAASSNSAGPWIVTDTVTGKTRATWSATVEEK